MDHGLELGRRGVRARFLNETQEHPQGHHDHHDYRRPLIPRQERNRGQDGEQDH